MLIYNLYPTISMRLLCAYLCYGTTPPLKNIRHFPISIQMTYRQQNVLRSRVSLLLSWVGFSGMKMVWKKSNYWKIKWWFGKSYIIDNKKLIGNMHLVSRNRAISHYGQIVNFYVFYELVSDQFIYHVQRKHLWHRHTKSHVHSQVNIIIARSFSEYSITGIGIR